MEVSDELLQEALKNGFVCTTDLVQLRNCNFYIVGVPTSVDVNNRLDLAPLIGASTTVGKVISKGDSLFTSLSFTPASPRKSVCLWWKRCLD